PAGTGGRVLAYARGAHVELLDDPLGVTPRRGPVEHAEQPARGHRLATLEAEDAVGPQRLGGEQPVAGAVLGHVPDARLAALERVRPRDVLAGQRDRAAAHPAHAHDRLDELGLAVALDARDPEHLPGVHHEVHAVEHRATAALGLEGEPGDAQDLAVGDRGLPGLRAGQLAADHHLG